MIILGIGNGLADLMANWIVAEHGWPAVAVSAIYGSSVLNLFVGVALIAVVGVTRYGCVHALPCFFTRTRLHTHTHTHTHTLTHSLTFRHSPTPTLTLTHYLAQTSHALDSRRYGNPYYVTFDIQNLLGMGVNLVVIAVTIAFVWLDRTGNYFRRVCGITLVTIYAAFFISSIVLEVVYDRNEMGILR